MAMRVAASMIGSAMMRRLLRAMAMVDFIVGVCQKTCHPTLVFIDDCKYTAPEYLNFNVKSPAAA
jgi:hypothetical protein